MRLDPSAFNTFLGGIGQQVEWRRASICPCINEYSGAADPSCPLCRGKGQIWAPPVESVIGISRQDAKPQWAQFGNMEAGDMIGTIGADSPVYAIGRYDRVVCLNSTDRFSRVLKRGENDWLDMRLQTIERVYWLTPDRTATVEGDLPAWDAATGVLSWLADTDAPPPGVQYSIVGTRFDEYFVWDAFPSDRNMHSGAALPRRVPLRRWDLFGR